MLSSSGREAAMFTVAGLFPLKPVVLYSLKSLQFPFGMNTRGSRAQATFIPFHTNMI